MNLNRRNFIKQTGLVSLGFIGLQAFTTACSQAGRTILNSFPAELSYGYGPLQDDPLGILNLPKGFSYKIISKRGEQMGDGLIVPGLADGMAAFPGPNGTVVLVRNHEISPGDQENSGYAMDYSLLDKIPQSKFYDFGNGIEPCLGGTTNVVYDPKNQVVIDQFMSLAGTVRNCSGGPTPWGSWITCEENVSTIDDTHEKNHGYTFEVPASATPSLIDPIPISDMGRFYREAVCVDPRTGIVYQTEDRPDGLIYRFIPNVPGKLHKGGKQQILCVKGQPQFETRNWEVEASQGMNISKGFEVEWIDAQDIHSPQDDLRYRGYEQGGARFARGEGIYFGENELYIACTNGGFQKHGQIFKYTPSPYEGQTRESEKPGVLELMLEPNNNDILANCDNLTMNKLGHLVLCEDNGSPRISGITPNGEMYHIAHNVGYKSEFAGSTFSPDGSTLFVNIQIPGLTVAITGPWDSFKV